MSEDEPKPAPLMHFELTVYQYHRLLAVLEDELCVINRDQAPIVALFETLATQASGRPVKVIRREQPAPEPKPEPKPDPPKQSSWWERLKGRV